MTESLDKSLVTAVIHQNLELVRQLLARGANPNVDSGFGTTALFFASTGNTALIDLLLESGANAQLRQTDGSDLLHYYLVSNGPGQSRHGASVINVQRILDAGIDVRARNHDKPHLPSGIAARRPAVVALLLAAGADPNGKEVLWEAIKTGDQDIFRALVEGGIDPNAPCVNAAAHTTILTEVCKLGDLETAQKLLDRGADPNAKGRSTPLASAQESGNQVLVDLLLERGARSPSTLLAAELTRALDLAESEARANPEDRAARRAWARALLNAGFHAAAASELLHLGEDAPTIEAPGGQRWTFLAFHPRTAGVAPRIIDARFPGARVTDGVRTMPLLLTRGAPCTACDERGEQVCTTCGGNGSYSSFLDPDHDVDCDPRQTCSTCLGLKFAVTGKRLGKGHCRHPRLQEEMSLGRLKFSRCQDCGLAAITGLPGRQPNASFACAVCSHFICSCDFIRS